MLLPSLLLLTNLYVALGDSCYHCVSTDAHLQPTLRRQLKTQTDVFFWQIGMQWSSCSADVVDNPSVEGQICSKYDLCVTLQPNIPNGSFVIRGCLENVLRHHWREDDRLHSEGCYMIRSIPEYPNNSSLDYVICVCKGDYCNGHESAEYVASPTTFASNTVLKLASRDDMLYVKEDNVDALYMEISSAYFTQVYFISLSFLYFLL